MSTISELERAVNNYFVGDRDPLFGGGEIRTEISPAFSGGNELRSQVTVHDGRPAGLVFPRAMQIQTDANTLFIFSRDHSVGNRGG